jgi:hypothetical protein
VALHITTRSEIGALDGEAAIDGFAERVERIAGAVPA